MNKQEEKGKKGKGGGKGGADGKAEKKPYVKLADLPKEERIKKLTNIRDKLKEELKLASPACTTFFYTGSCQCEKIFSHAKADFDKYKAATKGMKCPLEKINGKFKIFCPFHKTGLPGGLMSCTYDHVNEARKYLTPDEVAKLKAEKAAKAKGKDESHAIEDFEPCCVECPVSDSILMNDNENGITKQSMITVDDCATVGCLPGTLENLKEATTVSTVTGKKSFVKGWCDALSSHLRFVGNCPATARKIVSGVEMWAVEHIVAYTKSKFQLSDNVPEGVFFHVRVGEDVKRIPASLDDKGMPQLSGSALQLIVRLATGE